MGDYLSVLMDLSLIESWKRRASEILNEKDFQLKRIPKKKKQQFSSTTNVVYMVEDLGGEHCLVGYQANKNWL